MKAKFEMGRLVCTPGVLEALEALTPPVGAEALFLRHSQCDWGVMDKEDQASNQEALAGGGTLQSAYQLTPALKVLIITEADRSVSTMLLTSEY